ncbi:MAG: 2Fe-2S iron-sulfur cluster-binding protein, partial [Polaromonas sp.]|nr:2Fe-2S iron-sulfur cluster-binding protein [Polaromonas sp.]
MESPTDALTISRRGILIASAASAAVTTMPSDATAAPSSPLAAPGSTPQARVTLEVNGTAHTLALDTRTTLLDALREHLHLTGTKKGCDHGQCGA